MILPPDTELMTASVGALLATLCLILAVGTAFVWLRVNVHGGDHWQWWRATLAFLLVMLGLVL